jgi:hypothetical protein
MRSGNPQSRCRRPTLDGREFQFVTDNGSCCSTASAGGPAEASWRNVTLLPTPSPSRRRRTVTGPRRGRLKLPFAVVPQPRRVPPRSEPAIPPRIKEVTLSQVPEPFGYKTTSMMAAGWWAEMSQRQ